MCGTHYVSVREVAVEVGVPVAWLREQIDAGRVPHVRAGRLIRCNPIAVAEALDAMAAQGNVDGGPGR